MLLYLNKLICQTLLGDTNTKNIPYFLQNRYMSSDGCPLSVIPSITYSKFYKSEPKEKKKKVFAWKNEAELMKSHLLTDEELHCFCQKLHNKIYLMGIETDGGEFRFFEGNTRGGGRYNKKTQWKIQDTISVFCSGERETAALTITYDVEKFGENRFNAWKNYTSHIHSILEYYRKHLDAKYIWVKESTSNGYPHAHIVLSFPKGTIDNYEHLKNRQKIKFSEFGLKMQKRLYSKIWDLEKVSGKNLKYYLSKYISKSTTGDLKKMGDPNYCFNKSERKMLLGLFSTIFTQTRQWGKTTIKNLRETFPKAEERALKNLESKVIEDADEILKERQNHIAKYIIDTNPNRQSVFERSGKSSLNPILDYTEEMKSDMAKIVYALKEILSGKESIDRKNYEVFRSVLIKLCNNSPTPCENHIFTLKRQKLKDEMKKDLEDLDPKNESHVRQFKKNAKVFGCEGCFLSDINNIVSGNITKRLMFPIGEENGKTQYLFSPEVYADDVVFVQNFLTFWVWVQKKVYQDKMLYGDVIDELRNKKNG